MENLYCVICSKSRKIEKPKISQLLGKTFALSVISSKCKNEDEKIFKEEKSIEILKTLGLITNKGEYQTICIHAWRKHESTISIEKIFEIRKYLIEEINQNELMSKKHKKTGRVLNEIDNSPILRNGVTWDNQV